MVMVTQCRIKSRLQTSLRLTGVAGRRKTSLQILVLSQRSYDLEEFTVPDIERMINDQEHWLLFQRTQIPFPKPTQQHTTTCNSGSRGSDTLFWRLWAPGTHIAAHRDKTFQHIKIKQVSRIVSIHLYKVFIQTQKERQSKIKYVETFRLYILDNSSHSR